MRRKRWTVSVRGAHRAGFSGRFAEGTGWNNRQAITLCRGHRRTGAGLPVTVRQKTKKNRRALEESPPDYRADRSDSE